MAVPTFQAIVVIDIESFGSRANPFQVSLRRAMREVITESCTAAGVDWSTVEDLDRGDGLILLVPPSTSTVTLAGAFVRRLDATLGQKAAMFSEAHRMRLRVALHQGNCERDETGWVGEAINTACRLVDAQPLRDALAAAPEARMALIVSHEIYQGVVRHDYPLIDAASFGPAVLDVKELTGEKVWISVPGRPYPPGLPTAPARRAEPPRQPVGTHGGIVNNGGTTVRGDQVGGDKTVYLRAGRDE